MKTLTHEQVYNNALEYFNNDELAASVWTTKYALSDDTGNYIDSSPDDMHKRIAKEFARIEMKYQNPLSYDEIYNMLKDFKYFIPGGSGMYGIGNDYSISSLANCFVVGNTSDSYGGIMKLDEELVQLMKRRGGVGMDISHLRPAGSNVTNAAKSSTGAISFMERFSNSTREVAQGGRRGALMETISISHNDVEHFINIKDDLTKVTGANISIRVTDEFMHAVETKSDYILRFPVDNPLPEVLPPLKYNKLFHDKVNNVYYTKIKAVELWNKFIHQTWKTAEPGLLYWDTILRETPSECYKDFGFKTVSTNPCFTGDMKLKTVDGYIDFHTLYATNNIVDIYEQDNNTICKARITYTGVKKIIKLELSNNTYLKCTPGHVLMSTDGSKIRAAYSINHKLKNITDTDISVITIIDNNETVDVYDFTMENSRLGHWGIVNDIIVHNCGEIILSAYDSCRLSSINLYNIVDNPFTQHATINYDRLRYCVFVGQKLMDDFIDLEQEKLDKIISKIYNDKEQLAYKQTEIDLWKKIKNSLLEGRRTGLGMTALADMFAALNIKYDSDLALEIIENIYKVISAESYKTSIIMAKERGKFPVWNKDLEKDNPYIMRIMSLLSDDVKEMYNEYGRRNICNLTIAPNGSISTITQTSSGIEPVFKIVYKRRKKISPEDKNATVDFIDAMGDKWQEFIVAHPKYLEYLKINNYTDTDILQYLTDSPYYKCEAEEIDYLQKVKMQGIVQKYIDHSISITTNLPEHITEEEVSKIYMLAWKSGCKGATIYRSNSRSGVLVDINENNNQSDERNNKHIVKHQAPKRPKSLPCDIHHITAMNTEWIVLIGLMNNEPYEVFAFKKTNIKIPYSKTKGEIIKVKTGVYNLIIDGIEFENISTLFEQHEQEAITRLLSMALRHGVEIEFIVEQLNKSGESIVSFSKSISRSIKKYIKEGAEVQNEKCPQCGGNLKYIERCISCSCGWSKC